MGQTNEMTLGQLKKFINQRMLVLLLIIGLALTVRIKFATGVVFDQSVSISKYSWQLASSFFPNSEDAWKSYFTVEHVKQIIRPLRDIPNEYKLISMATGLSYLAFGVNDFSSVLPTILSSVIAIIVLYLIGRYLINDSVGMASGFLLAILPIDIFLATALLPVLLLTCVKLLAIYVFLLAKERRSRFLYVASASLIIIGLVSNWKIFLPTTLFAFLLSLPEKDKDHFSKLGWISIIAVPMLFFIPAAFSDALDLYFSALLILENLIYLPLIFMGLVYASKFMQNKAINLLVLWISIEALYLVFAAHWIKADPLFATIGMSGYWLQLVIPATLLIAWQFVEQLGDKVVRAVVKTTSLVLLPLAILLIVSGSGTPSGLDTVSRISLGLGFVFVWLYLFFLRSPNWIKTTIFSAFVLLFSLGSLILVKMYSRSYSYLAENPKQAIGYLKTAGSEINLQVAGSELYNRILYLTGFEEDARNLGFVIRLTMLNPSNVYNVPENNYVLVENYFQKYVLGVPPDNWHLIKEFGQVEDQKVLLYLVE